MKRNLLLSLGAVLIASSSFAQLFDGGSCEMNVTIPDNDSFGITATINVSGLPTNFGTNIVMDYCELFITHPYGADLTVTLRSPNGTTVILTEENGGSGTQYGADCQDMTVFYENALVSVTTGSGDFTSSEYMPEESFSAWTGEDPNGTWTLRVWDDYAGDIGELEFIELDFETPTGIDEASAATLVSIFPNPTTGQLSITLEEASSGILSIRNYLGQLIKQEEFNITRELNLNLDGPSGIYFIQLEIDGQIITKKVVRN